MMNLLAEKYQSQVQTIFVYILEAHATDEWYVASINEVVAQHKCLEDRKQAAKLFLQQYPLHKSMRLLLDNEENVFNGTYSSWPFRYWIVETDGRIALKAMPEGDQLTLDALVSWLEKRFPEAS